MFGLEGAARPAIDELACEGSVRGLGGGWGSLSFELSLLSGSGLCVCPFRIQHHTAPEEKWQMGVCWISPCFCGPEWGRAVCATAPPPPTLWPHLNLHSMTSLSLASSIPLTQTRRLIKNKHIWGPNATF